MDIVHSIGNFFKVIIIIAIITLLVWGTIYYIKDSYPKVPDMFQQTVELGGDLERKYLYDGIFTPKKILIDVDKPMDKYTIYYPSRIEKDMERFPLVIVVAGKGYKASKFEPLLVNLASWGFIAIGVEDTNTRDGNSLSNMITYMLKENRNTESIFSNHIDIENIALLGHGQVAEAILEVSNKYDIKTSILLSPVCENNYYKMDSSKIKSSILILAETHDNTKERKDIPISEINRIYDNINTYKVLARKKDTTSDDMFYSSQGYVNAWLLWQLKNDDMASRVFNYWGVDKEPEIIANRIYQDQRIN